MPDTLCVTLKFVINNINMPDINVILVLIVVVAARVKVAEAKAVLVESEANYERSLNLVKQEVISEAALDKALASRDARLVNLSNKTMNT